LAQAQQGVFPPSFFHVPCRFKACFHQHQANVGGASDIRDIDLLKSALGIPAATYSGEFLHTDVYETAAAYLFHLVKNHPLLDGNKRVGAVACQVRTFRWTMSDGCYSKQSFCLA
jgi:prophage maintenance system killer protein